MGRVSEAKREREQKKYGKMQSALIIMFILVLYHVISSRVSFVTRKENNG
jgi:hypothetical protein